MLFNECLRVKSSILKVYIFTKQVIKGNCIDLINTIGVCYFCALIFEVSYRIVYRNKGYQVELGGLQLNSSKKW